MSGAATYVTGDVLVPGCVGAEPPGDCPAKYALPWAPFGAHFRCTRNVHADDLHVAVGSRPDGLIFVIALWNDCFAVDLPTHGSGKPLPPSVPNPTEGNRS